MIRQRKKRSRQKNNTVDFFPEERAKAAATRRIPQSRLIERIPNVMALADGPLSMREIALRLNCPVDGRLRKAISELRAAGAVVMVGRRRGARYTVDEEQ